jgi:hypothetical protein
MEGPETLPAATRTQKTRRSRPWHRVLGLLTALPLVWVVITGALLNHTVDWKLDRIQLSHPWLLRAYGMLPTGEPVGVMVGRNEIVEWDGQLFLNAGPLEVPGSLVGAVADGDGLAVVTSEAVLRLDQTGAAVETLDQVSLPGIPLTGVATANGGTLLRNADGWFLAAPDWLEFTPAREALVVGQTPSPVADENSRNRLRSAWSRGGLPASRVLLDLHAGRFLGSFARYFYDFVALCTLGLCLTGLILFFRKPRRNR